MLDSLIERYKGQTTAKGHEIRVDHGRDGSVVLWYLFWGEYRGVDDHHHMGIARVRLDGNQYAVDLYSGTSQDPVDTRECSDLEAVAAIIDAELSSR